MPRPAAINSLLQHHHPAHPIAHGTPRQQRSRHSRPRPAAATRVPSSAGATAPPAHLAGSPPLELHHALLIDVAQLAQHRAAALCLLPERRQLAAPERLLQRRLARRQRRLAGVQRKLCLVALRLEDCRGGRGGRGGRLQGREAAAVQNGRAGLGWLSGGVCGRCAPGLAWPSRPGPIGPKLLTSR
jgi:hypothetical protein